MSISGGRAIFGLNAVGTGDRPWMTGSIQIGFVQTSINLGDSDIAWASKLLLLSDTDTATLDLNDFSTTGASISYPATITVTGIIGDGTNPITFPTLLFAGGNASGKPVYTDSGSQSSPDYYSEYSGTDWAVGAPTGSWVSTSDTDSPDLATGWTPSGPETGTPTLTGGGAITTTGWDRPSADYQGDSLPVATSIEGIAVYCETGSGTITNATDLVIPFVAGATVQLAATAGIAELLADLTFTATADNTLIYVAVIATR